MLTPYKPHFVEQIFTDQTGRQFRLVFLVSLVEGKLKGQLVSAQPISHKVKSAATPIFLPISCAVKKTVTEYIASFAPVISPYNNLEFLIHSQPTRAPSGK